MKTHGNLVYGECFDSLFLSVGKLIVTCGSLEFETYVWIWGFSTDEADKENGDKGGSRTESVVRSKLRRRCPLILSSNRQRKRFGMRQRG